MINRAYLLLILCSMTTQAASYRMSNGIEFEVSNCLGNIDCKEQLMHESPVKVAKLLSQSKNLGETKSVLNSYLDKENFRKFDSLYRLRTVSDQDLLNKRDGVEFGINLRRKADSYKFSFATDYLRNNSEKVKKNSYIRNQLHDVIRNEIKNSSPLEDNKKEKLKALHTDGFIDLSQLSPELLAEVNAKSDECYDCSVQTEIPTEYMSVSSLYFAAQAIIKVTSTWSSECDLDKDKAQDDIFFYNKTRRAKRELERHQNSTYINQETFNDGCTKKIEAKAYRK